MRNPILITAFLLSLCHAALANVIIPPPATVAVTGDISIDATGVSLVNKIQTVSVGSPTGTAGSAVVLADSPTFTTGITDPVLTGGTAAGSTLTIRGTSNGSPASAYVNINPTNGQFVGIGTSTPAVSLDVGHRTDAIALPIGTTGQRPTPATGNLRYNSTRSSPEVYSGTSTWQMFGGCHLVAGGATGWTDTAIGTSEVNLVSVALPPMGANDFIRAYTQWTSGGTLTDTRTINLRLGTSGCTSLSACSSGTSFIGMALSASNQTTVALPTFIYNRNATNSQVGLNGGTTQPFGNSSGAFNTGSIDTSATPYINIDATTNTSSADSLKLEAYSIELCTP
jgi:hypothetical protein